jgi:hypothetical protein
VKPVKELDLEASIPRCQTLDSKAALIFGAAYLSPSDEAFGARSAPVEIPEETPPESVDGAEEGRGKLKVPHSIGRQGVEHGIQQHNPAT